MGKRTVYTKITPLPSNIPRQLALDMLHSHAEMIQLNPLVTGVKAIEAPRDSAPDEFFSQWYDISEIITWGLGMKKKISFKGVFHDQPWGLQSHVYAPMGTDLRSKYRIGGNQPGEPREARELGVDTPADGLYLREDMEIVCSVPLTMGFVKKEMKAATATMLNRLTRKAELLEEGQLHAMFENGKLKTAKPSQHPTYADMSLPSPNSVPPGSPQPPGSPELRSASTFSPALDQKGYGRYQDVVARHASQSSQRHSYVPQYQQQGYNGPDYPKGGADLANVPEIVEMAGDFYHSEHLSPGLYPPPLKSHGQVFRSELEGDYTLAPRQPSAEIRPASQYQAYQQQQQPSPQPSPAMLSRQGSQASYQPQASPQPNPALPNRQGSNSSSNYRISNPDVPVHPAHRATSAQSTQVADWQRGLGIASPDDPNSIRHSVASSQGVASQGKYEPDHQRFSQVSIQQTPVTQLPYDPSGKGVGAVSKCPVCGLFEGDAAAVSHHVSRAHFT
ncbi:hypothetical protein LTR36_005414 [Oleoguttula mirabilis]|uniref:DUF7053 domain-containing protein n=1 Tax=Oleoguttula mirabilis TaxID=1507867 RepID=A0AAV9JFF2_9PEZI|nr:hypothetical protein LTR36_005414 [Oleoguttula mirabilis]